MSAVYPAFVSPSWLAEHIGEAATIDASWHMPADGRSARGEYEAAHIEGAVFWDVDGISDRQSPYPHMLPMREDFAAAMGAFGIDPARHAIVYDTCGLFSAPRVWHTLRAFGHDAVSVLEGGLPAWRRQGYATTSALPRPVPLTYPVPASLRHVATAEDVLHALRSGGTVLDARSAERFAGTAPEPRAGVRAGHMPHARNLPYGSVIAGDGMLLPRSELRQKFAEAGADAAAPFIASCGSGITACILAIAAYALGNAETRIYDGSWSEWGARADLPVATGDVA